MSKITTISLLTATAMLCFAAPSYAQYGSGTAYGNSSRSIPSQPTQADIQRAQRRAEKRAIKKAEKAQRRAEKKAKKQAELDAHNGIQTVSAVSPEKTAQINEKTLMKDEHTIKGHAMKDHSMKEGAVLKGESMFKPINCPVGTLAQDNGTCLLTDDVLPRI